MDRSSAKRLSAFIVSVAAGLLFAPVSALFGANTVEQKAAPSIKTGLATRHGISRPLREMNLPRPKPGATRREIHHKPRPGWNPPVDHPAIHDPARQSQAPQGGSNMPGPIISFEGVGDVDFLQPADTNAEVGPNNVAQWVNISFEIWDKDGNDLTGGPVEGNALWSGFGGDCENINSGDPIVLYDQLADRWVFAQPTFTLFGAQENRMCFAVSVTPDPLGDYFLYEFPWAITGVNFHDYPKLSVWPDAYYVTGRDFDAQNNFSMAFTAYDRNAMLAGADASQIYVNLENPNMDGLLGANLEGLVAPGIATNRPAGAPTPPELLVSTGHPLRDGSPTPVLHLFYFHPDFGTPANSTFVGPVDVQVDDYDPVFEFVDSVPQPPPGGGLEANGWIQYRASYRNFGDHESVVVEHDVKVDGEHVGPRWYELRDPFGTPTIYQQGSYGPDDGLHRWMGSAAMDANNNIAVGFSVVDGVSTNPGIRWAGRLASDDLGTLGQGEAELIAGDNPFGGFRWGDYSSLVIDPVDQCTFWYTTMYAPGSAGGDWSTRIGSFKFPSCTLGPSGTISGTVTDGSNPLPGVRVTAGAAGVTTDAAGHYTLTLPVGTYDMTAKKYGFFPGTANDVVVVQDTDTPQDFTLSAAPSTLVNGTVKDGSGGGWPLPANITITAAGAPTFHLATDAATGYYEITLVEGIVYNFNIQSVVPGYLPGGGPLDLTGTVPTQSVVKNWTLLADISSCNAPGYTQTFSGLAENFEGGAIPDGWQVVSDSSGGSGFPTEWIVVQGTDPCGDYSGNLTGGTGFFAVVNSDCPGPGVHIDSSLITSTVDMSAFSSAVVRFHEDYRSLGDNADVDISTDGGDTWTNVLAQTSDQRGPRTVNVDISSVAVGHNSVQARFHNYNADFAWWWQVDDVQLGQLGCVPGGGGLVVGHVTSTATGNGLNGATVEVDGGNSTKTFAAAGQGDGFYAVFADAGNQSLTASQKLYGSVSHNVLVVPGATENVDFSLPSGKLAADPLGFQVILNPGGTLDQTLNLTNSGGVAAQFHLRELNVPPAPADTHRGPFVSDAAIKQALSRLPNAWQKQVRADKKFSVGRYGPFPGREPVPSVPTAAGDVLANYSASFATPNGLPFGAMFDNNASDFYISNLGSGFPGDNKDHEFASDGTETGEVIDVSSLGFLPVDGTFNGQTGTFWQATNDFFGGSITCIYEIDPASKALTGNTICPNFPTPQTGLAYDVSTDTYYSGSFFDGVVNHFDSSGAILDQGNVGLSISGLAYNSGTGHLFAFQQTGAGTGNDDVYILDPANGYNVIGSFKVGAPGITQLAAGGAEMDCDGHLILVDQLGAKPIFVVDSGEVNTSCHFVNTIPWVTEDPTDGSVGAATPVGNGSSPNPLPIAMTFDATGLLPGLRQAQLTFSTDTPNPVPAVPLSLVVRFLDVPDDNQFQAFIYGAAGAGIMMGGPPNCATGTQYFCPNGIVTRADMAGYIFRAKHGAQTPPPVYQNIFGDVTFNDYNAFYIQGIFNDGITAGCGNGNYCPNSPNTRAQMSVFVVKAQQGGNFVPPPAQGIFGDVPANDPFAPWIEYLYNQGVTAGCGGGNFCPNANISNGQMATFLVKAFNIPHL